MNESQIDQEVVRLARVLQSSMHEILAAVDDLEPEGRAVALRDTEPLRLISRRMDQDLAEYGRLRDLPDPPLCRGRRPRRASGGGRVSP
jgi:hypothetical protein